MTNLLLKVIKTCRRTPYRLAKEAGISSNLIYEFMKGNRDLRLSTADRLLRALNLEL